jgi:centromere protein J
MEFLERYHGRAAKNVRLIKQDFTDDGKVIKYFENDKKEIIFPSGVKKETFPDGYQITYFNNKDIKQIYPDGKEVYLFSENQTVQFKFSDGLQVFKFHDGQIEKNFPDGIKNIIYKDGTVKYIYPDQSDETIFPDGTLQKTDINGVITIDYVDQIRVFFIIKMFIFMINFFLCII